MTKITSMANTVSVYNFKGGVGKTTTTLNLGFSWSRSFKVLLLDFDPQCNLTASLTTEDSAVTIYEHVKGVLHDHPMEVTPIEITPYLHLIPGDYSMIHTESNSQFISFGHTIIQKLLWGLKGDYDFIIIDCPTNFGVLVKAILTGSKSILIPAVADSFSITGVQKLLTHLTTLDDHYSVNILGIFFNMYNGQLLRSQEKLHKARERFGDLIINRTISRSVRVGEASDIGKSINQYEPENRVSREFMELSEELLAKFDSQYLNDEYILPDLLEKVKSTSH
jgi:chromosome partitioning protein